MHLPRSIATAVVALAALGLAAVGTAHADPALDASASAFGANITGGGQDVVPPTPAVEVRMGAPDATETLIDVPAEPLAVSGTLTATAMAHPDSDVPSALTVNSHEVEGPFNVTGVGLVENLQVLTTAGGEGVPLLSAAVVRGEAVGVCAGETATYAANSEIIDLQIAGNPVPLNEPLEQLIDGVNQVLTESGLDQVVNIERNVVTQNPDGGVAVDALVVTLLDAAGQDPLGQVRLAHGEVGPLACGAPPVIEPEPALPRTGSDAGLLAAGAVVLGSAAVGTIWLRRRLLL